MLALCIAGGLHGGKRPSQIPHSASQCRVLTVQHADASALLCQGALQGLHLFVQLGRGALLCRQLREGRGQGEYTGTAAWMGGGVFTLPAALHHVC